MSTKHIYDSSDGLVLKSLRGAVRLNPALRLHTPSKSVYTVTPCSSSKVSVISGGGAGHEPAHAGYTGRGMLTASVSGDIFASPSAKQILNTIKLAALGEAASEGTIRPKDVLVVINNYTGDRLNFGLAIEKARVVLAKDGINIKSVVVADDVSLLNAGDLSNSMVGPRGLAGNVLVCKLLGALAARGANLEVMKKFGDAVVENLASIGVGLDHCHVPGREKGESSLGEAECEVGLGLHNEPGVVKQKIEGVEKLVAQMLSLILSSRDHDNASGRDTFIRSSSDGKGDDVVLFVNNLGGISQLEMGAVLDEIEIQLEAGHIYPVRIYLSSYMTSLNAPGFSISILNISAIEHAVNLRHEAAVPHDTSVLHLLDDPTEALAWIGVSSFWPKRGGRDFLEEEKQTELVLSTINAKNEEEGNQKALTWWRRADISPPRVEAGIRGACRAVLAVEKDLTRFDTIVGDGDCGHTFSAGANAILTSLETGRLHVAKSDPSSLIRNIAEILEDSMGGTIGALFCIFFNALAGSLQGSSISWGRALGAALEALSRHTPAKPGDRTVIDALEPFCVAIDAREDISEATNAAVEGAKRTRGMKARLGRAVYVSSAKDGELPPDPGALGVAAILEGLRDGFNQRDIGRKIN